MKSKTKECSRCRCADCERIQREALDLLRELTRMVKKHEDERANPLFGKVVLGPRMTGVVS